MKKKKKKNNFTPGERGRGKKKKWVKEKGRVPTSPKGEPTAAP